MMYIPGDIVFNILNRLPTEPDLLRFRIVCKEWKSIIDDPVFAKLHHGYMLVIKPSLSNEVYSLPLGSLTTETATTRTVQVKNINNNCSRRHSLSLASNCNGFILIKPSILRKVYNYSLWNPFTKEYLEFPLPSLPDLSSNRVYVVVGVGYDVAANDYKVVGMVKGNNSNNFTTMIYSMKSGVWRRIQDIFKQLPTYNAVFASGELHWLPSWTAEFVISLDLSSETYRELQLPSRGSVVGGIRYNKLYALDGCLFLTSSYLEPTRRWVLWTLQDYQGEKDKWIMLLELTSGTNYINPCCFNVVAYLKSKEQFVIQSDENKLILFDLKNNECLKTVSINGVGGFNCQVLAGSLDWLTGQSHRGGNDQSIKNDDELELQIMETSLSHLDGSSIRIVQFDD